VRALAAPSRRPTAVAGTTGLVSTRRRPRSSPCPGARRRTSSRRPGTRASQPAHGTLALAANGGFTYTPTAGYAGADTFTYRASDGTYQSPAATVTLTVTPTACVPRPRVQAAPGVGGGRLNVHVEATPLNTQQNNPLQQIKFGVFQNAKVTLNGQLIASGHVYMVPANTVAVDFTVERLTPGQPTTVHLTIVDGCGEWPTFVGGGTGAGF
jgi:hypothetical protein